MIVAVVALLVAGGLVDRAGSASARTASPASQPAQVAAAAPASAVSSSWFCAGATDTAGGAAPAQIVVTDAGASPVDARVTVVASQGAPIVVPVHVAARSRVAIPETVPGGAPWVGAVVDVQGGLTAVEQHVTGTLGSSVTPCATTTSGRWYFPSAQTLVNASSELTLLNPYPVAAIVDLSFSTEQGIEQPGNFQGIDVPAGGLVAVDLGSHLRRRQRIATTVSVRTGRVVAWKTDVVTPPKSGEPTIGSPQATAGTDPAAPIAGVTVMPGAPAPSTQWNWPEGDNGNGLVESYVVYNPSSAAADVSLGVGLDAGSATPLRFSVAPGGVSKVVSGAEARIPPGVGHYASLRSTNGVPVVAERLLTASPPSPVSGRGAVMGGTVAHRDWLLGGGTASAHLQEYVVVLNTGRTTATVGVERLAGGAFAGLGSVPLAPGRRLAMLINSHGGPYAGPIVVRASAPVFVERDIYGIGGIRAVSLSLGVPLLP